MHNNHTDRLEELAKECINGLDDAHDQLFVPKGEFDLAFEEGKGFFKIMAMASPAAAGWNEHVDQAITAIGIIAGKQNRVGIPSQFDVCQALISLDRATARLR